jgi:hypothetical protein
MEQFGLACLPRWCWHHKQSLRRLLHHDQAKNESLFAVINPSMEGHRYNYFSTQNPFHQTSQLTAWSKANVS